ncbi:MAG: radical SAM protein [Oscillospiraceae bacterium]|nr:radical SAM protein [Oscillospiraceae bacterium]
MFCNQNAIAGRPVSLEEVTEQIRIGLQKCAPAIPQVAFYGGSFTALSDEAQTAYLDAVQPFLKNGSVREIRLSTRPDAIDEACAARLFAAGVREIELGAQSMENPVLLASGRGHTAEDTRIASRIIKKFGFRLVLQMMVGLPGETSSKTTAHEIISLAPDAVRIYPVAVVKGTPLELLWREGQYQPLTLEQGVSICADLLELFSEHGIAVIRMGLHPTLELDHAVCAGVYHPAFGELVRSECFYRKARTILEKTEREQILMVHPSRLSCMIGQKKKNLIRLKEEFGQNIRVITGTVDENEIKRTSQE